MTTTVMAARFMPHLPTNQYPLGSSILYLFLSTTGCFEAALHPERFPAFNIMLNIDFFRRGVLMCPKNIKQTILCHDGELLELI